MNSTPRPTTNPIDQFEGRRSARRPLDGPAKTTAARAMLRASRCRAEYRYGYVVLRAIAKGKITSIDQARRKLRRGAWHRTAEKRRHSARATSTRPAARRFRM